jgi:hypothetical protein
MLVLPYTNSLWGCPASFPAVLAALPAARPPLTLACAPSPVIFKVKI